MKELLLEITKKEYKTPPWEAFGYKLIDPDTKEVVSSIPSTTCMTEEGPKVIATNFCREHNFKFKLN